MTDGGGEAEFTKGLKEKIEIEKEGKTEGRKEEVRDCERKVDTSAICL